MSDKLYSNFEYNSALNVQEGVEQPQQVNQDFLAKMKRRKPAIPTVEEFVEGILAGNRTMLSRAITLVESTLAEHQAIAQQVIERCLPYTGRSVRVGITGVPGAGKSSTIEVLGTQLTAQGHKVAVLAIDPSSERSKGSILGDKTRMERLSVDPNAFIRPSPTAGSLGGVARKTREIILLCEASGFDVVLVETVGVGQSEVAAHSMVDFFVLLQLANTGDELQGIKRGIMEMADMVVINKCDIDRQRSEMAAGQIRNALHLMPRPESGWDVQVVLSSAETGEGVEQWWKKIEEYLVFAKSNGFFEEKRKMQNLRILNEYIEIGLRQRFYSLPGMEERLEEMKAAILSQKISAYKAADQLLETKW